ncbi:MAG: hypothetical protein RLZ18_1168 [Actinomycetota bacterium]|jgi:hypothetical protein
MAHYVATIPSSLSAEAAFAYMCDLRNFAEWDRGIKKVEQVKGDGPGLGAVCDITVRGAGGRDDVLRYETLEFEAPRTILVKGRNNKFTSIDRVTVTPTATGCDVTYDAILTANGIYFFMNFALGRVFQKVGDAAVAGLRKKIA